MLLCQLIPFGIILWRLARRRQVDGTSCALSRTPVRFKSIAGLLAFNVELVKNNNNNNNEKWWDPYLWVFVGTCICGYLWFVVCGWISR